MKARKRKYKVEGYKNIFSLICEDSDKEKNRRQVKEYVKKYVQKKQCQARVEIVRIAWLYCRPHIIVVLSNKERLLFIVERETYFLEEDV